MSAEQHACENESVKEAQRDSPLWQRVLLSATVALALVGMHHLTSLGCSGASAEHGTVHLVTEGPLSGLEGNPVDHETLLDSSSPGLICLAVLIAFGVIRPLREALLSRKHSIQCRPEDTAFASRTGDPPNLHALSISRT